MELGPGRRPDLWSGTVAWTPDGGRWQPWRLPPEEEPYVYAPGLYQQARIPAGVRFAASVRARRLEFELVGAEAGCGPADVLLDGRLTARQQVEARTLLCVDLPSRPTRVEVWLPHRGRLLVGPVRAAGLAAAAPLPAARRWVAYGSSITQCAASEGPSQTWPALVARELGWDLTCLGFGAECHLDPVVPRAIAASAPDVVCLCLGINVYGRASFSARTWPGQVAGVVRHLRAALPDAELVVGSPISCPARESTPNGAGLTLAGLRDDVHRVAADLRSRGDRRVHVLDGRSLLGPDDVHLLHDGLHPSADGYRMMAARMRTYLATLLA
ncbi:GDSL-type esterase/lipase family protein [Jiangella alba]|uniref:Lysophospholipase L1 n=1 Tax=Jiangella alba TaxID=561176 RepID=A0A1H5PYN1_9ACTN|nr:GDSL-type esterase/lipase family protein [Jiangella alba]SEF18117.1 Lysophospholipase L1 [Jiangella alba]